MIVPIDHGLTIGPVDGLESAGRIAEWIDHPALTGVIVHKGMLERLVRRGVGGRLGVLVHVNGMSTLAPEPDRKELLTSVRSAVRLGADGVSLQINFDGANDAHNLALLGQVVDQAQQYGLPVLTMLYDKLAIGDAATRLSRMRHLLRIAVELGSDALKIAAPEDLDELAPLLHGIAEETPVYFAGGPLRTDEEMLALARAAVLNGAAGLCVGRNVFQRPKPGVLLDRLAAILIGKEPALPAQKPLHSWATH